jgi:hypothetical protein
MVIVLGCLFQLKLLYTEKGVARTPSGRFKKWFNHSSTSSTLATGAGGLGVGATALGATFAFGAGAGAGDAAGAGAGANKSVNLDIVIKNFLIIYYATSSTNSPRIFLFIFLDLRLFTNADLI